MSLEEFLQNKPSPYLREPIIIEDISDFWEVCDYSLEALLSRFGDVELWKNNQGESVLLQHMLDTTVADSTDVTYSGGARLPENMRPMFPIFFTNANKCIPPQLWVGNVKQHNSLVTRLHRDCSTGYLGQVFGRKRVVLYPPSEADCLYTSNAFNLYQPCLADPLVDNFNRYPKLKATNPVEVVLKPGNLLIQPAGWFHSVYAVDKAILSVSYFEKRSVTLELMRALENRLVDSGEIPV